MSSAALFLSPFVIARPSLCALSALRAIVGGATMTISGGARTLWKPTFQPPSARRTGFYHGSELPGYRATTLRFAPLLSRRVFLISTGGIDRSVLLFMGPPYPFFHQLAEVRVGEAVVGQASLFAEADDPTVTQTLELVAGGAY
jgi:hypothetical protein